MKEKLATAGAAIVGALIGYVFFGWVVMALWNHFTFLAALQQLTWFDGFLLYILAVTLFKHSK